MGKKQRPTGTHPKTRGDGAKIDQDAVAALTTAYRPQRPRRFRPRIGLIGCGGVVETHLEAYRKARYRVVALADPAVDRARQRRDQFYPRADVYASAEQLLARPDVDVVDIATHPAPRVALIELAIRAGKHVLSQKPFVTDLAVGKRLIGLARRKHVQLAVNQNGRWAPHVSYARHAIAAGLLGEVSSVDLSVHWDHNWCAGAQFDKVPHLALFDFGIHWFDMVRCYMGNQHAQSVYATTRRTRSQCAKPPLLAQAVVQFARGQASLVLRGDTRFGPQDRTVIVGTNGTLVSSGPDLNAQKVTLFLGAATVTPRLRTRWFPDGFDGAMSELLCAIEEEREPSNSARDNLQSLALCFAAMRSADSGKPQRV